MIVIDKLCYLSKLRYTNPSEKFAFAIITLVLVVISRSIAMGIVILFLNTYLTVILGGIPHKRYIKLMIIPLTFIFLSTLAIAINFSRVPLDLFSIPLGKYYITSSFESVHRCTQLIITALSAVSCLYFLALNTTMVDILSVLRKLHCPKLVCELMLLIYRFIFILLDVAYHIRTAQLSRLGYKNYKSSLIDYSTLVQTLFIKSVTKSRYLYYAMESRGYDGEINVLEENYTLSKKNIILITGFELFLLAWTILIFIEG